MMRVETAGPGWAPGPGLSVVFLGTKGGPPPSSESAGIATAVVVDTRVYLVDVGRSAVTQYRRASLAFASLRGVFITHLHVDHVADYLSLFLLAGNANPGFEDTLPGPVPVFGPGPAGFLPPSHGGGEAGVESPTDPTPGIEALTRQGFAAFAYSSNLFARDSGTRLTRTLADVHEIDVSALAAGPSETAPAMDPILITEDDRVRVTAVLVPHGPVFPAFAYRFDTEYGSVTLSGDTTYSANLIRLARDTDLLVHESINVEGFRGAPALVHHLLEGHVEVQRVGGVAQAARARHLALSHTGDLVHGAVDSDRWSAWAQQGYSGGVHVARDLDVLRLT